MHVCGYHETASAKVCYYRATLSPRIRTTVEYGTFLVGTNEPRGSSEISLLNSAYTAVISSGRVTVHVVIVGAVTNYLKGDRFSFDYIASSAYYNMYITVTNSHNHRGLYYNDSSRCICMWYSEEILTTTRIASST